ncbi:C6 finger domain [Lecanosticta acicola]|uniref:C6 finger domain n=1 Tax=Lecanosticta acicola TaxID=111012 RepID=A0AAI9EAM1_9PEZI|nr:C6 finger domain [Lecanosticta acicola]
MADTTSTANTGAAPDKTRRSRITAACAVCRAKRQKCSGQKPVCDQCRAHNEECWWSDQKKRGPAKDYLRSLQDRLQETEKLLLGVLNQASDDALHNGLQQANSNSNPPAPSHQTWTSVCSGQEYWAHYPLNELSSIRQWQQHRMSGDLASFQPNAPLSRHLRAATASGPPQAGPTSTGHSSAISRVAQNGPYYQTPHADQFNGDAGLREQPTYQTPSHERRYSEETRDVAQALYSISNHLVEGSTQPVPAQDAPSEPKDEKSQETLPSKFPEKLFW